MSRAIRTADIIGAVAGILFSVLVFLSVSSVDTQRGVTDQELQTWWADSGNRDGYVFSMYLLLLAGPLFLLFISRVRARLRVGDAAGWAEFVFGCGTVVSAGLGVEAMTRGVVAASVRFSDDPLPGVDVLRYSTELAYLLWNGVILFLAVLIAAASLLALATRALPRWLSILGLIVTVGCAVMLAGQVAAFSLPLIFIWMVANCVHLLRTPAGAPAEEANQALDATPTIP